jgi:phosphoribosyl 1,2-cyclic phosphate phosphodiesterase
MDLQNSVVILGSGTSTGVPTPGCHCKVCKSTNPKNKRFRASILIQTKTKKNILIDTTPDLRSQCLDNDIEWINATIITHEHADHLHGIDDLRPFCFGPPIKTIPVFTNETTAQAMIKMFPYIFQADKVFHKNRPIIGGGIPRLDLNPISFDNNKNGDELVSVQIEGESFQFFLVPHGHGESLGLYHDGLVYIPDCHEVPASLLGKIADLRPDVLIIDCLQHKPHQTHLNIQKCFDYIEKIQAKSTGLIHMNHHLDHQELENLAMSTFGKKQNVFPLYDRQRLPY